MISYEEALSIIKKEFCSLNLQTERIKLPFLINRILSRDVITSTDLPPFDNSAMDGYAVVYNEQITEWVVRGTISAGNYKHFSPAQGDAVEIMTGAKIPAGFNTVLPVEDIVTDGSKIKLKAEAVYARGINIRKAGEDIAAGEIILKSNTLITAKEIAALVSSGAAEADVFKKLKIGALTTGDELVDITGPKSDDQIRASNLYALIAAVQEIGMEPVNLGILKDDKKKITQNIASALASDIDILVTTGGVSAGKYDLMKEIFMESEIEIRFHKVNIKPGKPLLFGIYNKGDKFKPVFGLPGNPVSSLAGFIIFIKEGISSIMGIKKNLTVPAVLGSDYKKQDGKLHFAAGKIILSDGKFIAYPGRSSSSGNAAQLASSDCLIRIGESVINPRKGDPVNCILI